MESTLRSQVEAASTRLSMAVETKDAQTPEDKEELEKLRVLEKELRIQLKTIQEAKVRSAIHGDMGIDVWTQN
eukprot:symbB.v1.2.005427.t1/scaffold312.1/size231221/3